MVDLIFKCFKGHQKENFIDICAQGGIFNKMRNAIFFRTHESNGHRFSRPALYRAKRRTFNQPIWVMN